jgi:hypothetical protein
MVARVARECALWRADVLTFAKTTLFHNQGGIALTDGLEGKITVSSDALLITLELGSSQGDVHARRVPLEADHDRKGRLAVVRDQQVAGHVRTRFGAEQETGLPERLVFPLVFPPDVQRYSLWENADQLAQFGAHIPPPHGKVSLGVESEALRDDLVKILVTSFRGK